MIKTLILLAATSSISVHIPPVHTAWSCTFQGFRGELKEKPEMVRADFRVAEGQLIQSGPGSIPFHILANNEFGIVAAWGAAEDGGDVGGGPHAGGAIVMIDNHTGKLAYGMGDARGGNEWTSGICRPIH